MKQITNREKKEQEHFDALASDENNTWWGNKTPAAKVRMKRRAELLAYYLDILPGQKLLECGCGSGDFTKYIVDTINKDALINAIDLSKSQVNLATSNVSKSNVSFYAQSITSTKFKDGYFDYVVGNSILHHLDLNLAFSEIKRVLKPGGKLLFFEPNMLNPHVWLALNIKPFRKLYQASDDETAFYRWYLKKQMKNADLVNIIVKPFDFVHPLIPQKLIPSAVTIGNLIERTFINEIAGSLIVKGETKAKR